MKYSPAGRCSKGVLDTIIAASGVWDSQQLSTMLHKFVIALCVIFAVLASANAADTDQWTKIKNDIRMPLELRVVNEGLAHDDKSWFMSNQHFLYRTSLYPITIEVANHHAIPDELTKLRYNHIGDIDHDQGIVYGGMETSDSDVGILGAWNATDLSIIKYVYTEQEGMPWLVLDCLIMTCSLISF